MKNLDCHGLINHLLKTNKKEILEKSILNCHLKNLHSIMFLDSPGKIIRMFVAEPGHELYKNSPVYAEQSLAYHAHHCDLTLSLVSGNVSNIIIEKSTSFHAVQLGEFQYQSKILEGTGGFKKVGKSLFELKNNDRLFRGYPLFMKANEIHTVWVEKDTWAAWFVLEGAEDPDYKNLCWSKKNLEQENFDGLYQPMDEKSLERLLNSI